MPHKKFILTKAAAALKLQRLALEVAEQLNDNTTELIIIGIKNSGITIAEKIAMLLKEHIQQPIHVIAVTLNKANPNEVTLSESINFDHKNILICDDVSNSGKTLLYALKPLLHFHPKSIQTLVLVERMHKQFPINPDYVGLSLATTLQENIIVEIDNNEVVGAYIE
ncbi:MAG: phosphoribosyltransferase [Chitinophagaceae bacterium]|nr:phosphoribosyltransferase [Chitinophagaceae bacterium]MCW5904724.1 phosphoribosyltransferase [Chitinophagaceae bacterium]